MMPSDLDFKNVEQRLQQHFLIDGLLELILGFWLGLMSLYLLLDAISTANFYYLYIVLLIMQPRACGQGLRFLKRRVTAPRIGYVRFPRQAVTKNRRLVLGGVGLSALAGGMVLGYAWAKTNSEISNPAFWVDWLPLLGALILTSAFLYIAVRYRVRRFFILGGLLVAVGARLTRLDLDLFVALIMLSTAVALLMLTSGLVTLIAFLRQNPVMIGEDCT